MRKNLCFFAVLILLTGVLYSQNEENEVMSLIYANETERDADITILRKINMGIPGGDNWLVEWARWKEVGVLSSEEWDSRRIFVYVVKEGKIIFEERLDESFNIKKYTDFDIMLNIPGTRVGRGSCVVYDYNGDGFDEVFNYGFWGSQWLIHIRGYDPDKKGLVDYARIPFDIIDREKGPAPIEFITDKGMNGFKVYFQMVEVAGGPGWVPDPDPRNEKWIFFAWDKEQRKFVEVEEYVEETVTESIQPVLTEHDNVQKKTILSYADISKNFSFKLLIGIACIIVFAAVTGFIIVKRRKK